MSEAISSYEASYLRKFQGYDYYGPIADADPVGTSWSVAADVALSAYRMEQVEKATVSSVLRSAAGRTALRGLNGRKYSADTDAIARRSIIREAAAILTARAERVAARKVAEEACRSYPDRFLHILQDMRGKRFAAKRQLIIDAVTEAASGLYRVSGSSWAGGNHSTRVCLVDQGVSASGGSSRAWSKNGKWSGNDSSHTFQVKATWIDDVENRDLAVVDGMLTLDAVPILGHGPELFAAVWVEQGRGFDLKAVRGYIACSEEIAYHAPSARAALDGLARKLGQKPARRKGTLDLDRLVRRHGELPVFFSDSTAVGNCESGTISWCNAVGIDVYGAATVADCVRGYKLRPLPEVLAVIRRVVRDARNRQPVETMLPESSLESDGTVVFDNEGGFRIIPSDN